MQSQDRFKLIRAGFRIFRMHTTGPKDKRYSIWEYDGGWRKHSFFKTAAEMRSGWQALMINASHIGDE